MQVYRMETTISQDGKLSIKGLPFRKGDSVEVIVLMQKRKQIHERYLLRSKPVVYHWPLDSVVVDEWESDDGKISQKKTDDDGRSAAANNI